MIPAQFEYYKPDSVKAALGLLKEWGDDARVIAGGHSLIPVMKMRMSDIGHLIDLGGIDSLKGISISGDTVKIGAMTTQHELIAHEGLAKTAPIMRLAALQIADPQVRYLGTVGGNVANGDPANDMPGLMQALDANYKLAGPNGERVVKARDFYEAAYFTAREDDEILTEISFVAPNGGYAYEKQKRKIGDYATAAAAVLLSVEKGVCSAASIALTNLSDTPVYCSDAVEILNGSSLSDGDIAKAVSAAVDASNPTADTRGPVAFKKHVASVIIKTAMKDAAARS